MDLYAENILDHFRHPRHYGGLSQATIDNEVFNHACGDSLHIWLELERGIVNDIGWTGTGCAISQASMSMLSEELPGMSLEDIAALKREDILTMLGVPIGPRRLQCALMSLDVTREAIANCELRIANCRHTTGSHSQAHARTSARDPYRP